MIRIDILKMKKRNSTIIETKHFHTKYPCLKGMRNIIKVEIEEELHSAVEIAKYKSFFHRYIMPGIEEDCKVTMNASLFRHMIK